MGNKIEKPTIERITKPSKDIKERLADLEKWRTDVGKEIFDIKKDLAHFVFQSVSAIMGFFAILLAILLGFSANWNFEEKSINYVWSIAILIILPLLSLVVLVRVFITGVT